MEHNGYVSTNRVLLLILGAISVVAVVAGVLTATSQRPELQSGSPEAAVQQYLEAVIDGDAQQARERLDPDSKCTVDDLDRVMVSDVFEARLIDARSDGATAKVTVELQAGSAGLMSDRWIDRQTFYLKKSSEAWVITGTPWPMYECGGVFK